MKNGSLMSRRLFPSIGYVLLLSFLFAGCGKKGDPTLKAYEKPEAPARVRAIHRDSGITLLWDFPRAKEPTIRGFHLFKASSGDFRKITSLGKEIRSYTDADFTIGEEYRYRISSENITGILNESATLILKPRPLPPPPGRISFTIDHDKITLTWERHDVHGLYNVYRSARKGEHPLDPLNPEPLKETLFQDAFDINRKVYYSVRSTTGSDIRDEGPASEELMIDPLEFIPSAPENITAVPTGENIFLIWKEPPETWVTSYKVYRRRESEEGYIFIGHAHTPSFVDRDKEQWTAVRHYRVTAVGPFREGPPAEIKDVRNETAR